jgi:hypothetical protein
MPFGFSSETAFGFAGILRRPLRGLQGQGYGPEARLWGVIRTLQEFDIIAKMPQKGAGGTSTLNCHV